MVNIPRTSHVLVVDDEWLIRWALREALEAKGYRVTEAGDAASARRALAEDNPPDAVVLDYRLPDSNDLGLLTTIRHNEPPPPVIMMTAHGTSELVKGALDLGAYRVVSKPFEMVQMADLVAEALAVR
ncbi:MAG TPA: response regulator [Vicinamibacterales bacterium]